MFTCKFIFIYKCRLKSRSFFFLLSSSPASSDCPFHFLMCTRIGSYVVALESHPSEGEARRDEGAWSMIHQKSWWGFFFVFFFSSSPLLPSTYFVIRFWIDAPQWKVKSGEENEGRTCWLVGNVVAERTLSLLVLPWCWYDGVARWVGAVAYPHRLLKGVQLYTVVVKERNSAASSLLLHHLFLDVFVSVTAAARHSVVTAVAQKRLAADDGDAVYDIYKVACCGCRHRPVVIVVAGHQVALSRP